MLVTVDGVVSRTAADAAALSLEPGADKSALAKAAAQSGVVEIRFQTMGDGRGFSLARRLRAMGFRGRLRAAGPLIADQFAALARVGFDEVTLPPGSEPRLPAGARLAPRAGYHERLLRVG